MAYVHHIPGRMRVRTTVKREPARAAALAEWLRARHGVERAEVSPLTGSALIHYRVGKMDADSLLAEMHRRQWIAGLPVPAASLALGSDEDLKRLLARAILRSVAELAIQQSFLALAAALL